MTDGPSDSAAPSAVSDPASTPAANDFQPDVPPDLHVGAVASGGSSDPDLETTAFGARDPIEFDAPSSPGSDSAAVDEQQLVPGASIARGRYRLLVFHGGAPHTQFWQALDTALNRQVALTFVDPDGTLPDEQLREILARTMRLSRIDKIGIARILDVVHTGAGGLVVTEWVRGGSLQEVADTSPSAAGASRAMQSLAAAAEAAHHAGVALSIDHPSRVRVSIEGDVVLAFPATMPHISPEDDIRGIGAALYALLVNRWPLPESGAPSGMAQAPRDSAGQPLEPSAIDGDIPFQISAAAAHSLQGDSGIRSAATLLNLLQQATVVADRTELLAPIGVLASWNAIRERRKIFYALFLAQQTAMFGVFISLDLMLYYGFWELSLVPMAILIAMYGRKDGPRAAVKFFLFTFVPSAPLLVARREVRSDVAIGKRAQQRIDQSMQNNVSVGMSGEPARMRDPDASEHDMIAVAESVHIETIAGAHIAKSGHAHSLGANKIVVGR